VSASVRERLAGLDAQVQADGRALQTLSPTRARAPTPGELAETLLDPDDSAAFVEALAVGLEDVYRAVLRAFPGNLLWDFDGLFGSIVAHARSQADPISVLASSLGRVTALQDLFGPGPINFRYAHDFLYGFDWAKWVRRDPAARSGVGPYDRAFLEVLHGRGRELVDTIAAGDDSKYPPLPSDAPRNPFGFSRQPAAELALHRELAARGLVPVEAWSPCPAARWDRPFDDLRAEVARELGLQDDEPE
jgi:hypothetical protein